MLLRINSLIVGRTLGPRIFNTESGDVQQGVIIDGCQTKILNAIQAFSLIFHHCYTIILIRLGSQRRKKQLSSVKGLMKFDINIRSKNTRLTVFDDHL
jgi:hypothetical protein